MVNDRGSIKWTSLMLPEHVEMLKNLWKEDKKTKKPLLDEQQLEEMNRVMQEANSYQTSICITFYNRGFYEEVTGTIVRLDNTVVKIKTTEIAETIYLKDIINVR
ncbi:YolD-like family protein [Aquibacillus kalidii]|uniref:YolD-like family protein n=1 Tax=Aquibacillus kalidii TaxID=2762597 RepID=UPI0016444064|nr:YolD-like family protein [Aquibacillus kalidii]